MKTSPALHTGSALQRMVSACCLMTLLLGSLALSGCAVPMDPRKDAQFQSYAYSTNRPVVRPTRSLSSFSESLMCMDRMLRESQLPTTLITSKSIPDFSSKVPVAAKDMVITALSQMSRVSHAFRYVDYEVDIARQDTVQNLTTILLNNNQMQLQRPALYVSGAIAYVDQNVINNRYDVGTSAARLDTGYSQSRNATVIGLEMHLGDFRTRTLIPGMDSANEVIIGGSGQGLDLAGRIGSYGVKFNVGRDYSLGAGGALRTLIDLALIEMIGKWARVPYWQCLTLDQTHPDFQRQMRDWFDEGSPLVQNKLVQRSLVTQGYMSADDVGLGERSREFVAALGRFQADTGMVVTGVVDFATYERALRNFASTDNDGNLVQVGWSSKAGGATAIGTTQTLAGSSQPIAVLGAAPVARRIDMQIENALVGRKAFEVGEQVFLSASLSRASYLYCFLHEASGTVMRLLPNPTNPSALISANQAIRIPDWMSPTPGFIMDATAPGNEQVGCFATNDDVTAKLPQILSATALTTLPGTPNLNTIDDAFKALGNPGGYSTARVQWTVDAKLVAGTQAAPPAPAAAPAAVRTPSTTSAKTPAPKTPVPNVAPKAAPAPNR